MLTQDYALLCEHARVELGGKFTLIGLMNGIGVPMLPFPIPLLTFFHGLKADAAGQHQFTARLTELSTGRVLAQAQGIIQVQQAGPLNLVVGIGNVRFTAFGMYNWSLEIHGQDEPFVTDVNVNHVPMQMMRMPPRPN